MDADALELQVKKILIEQLFLDDLEPSGIDSTKSLYEHYGLDSMTVLQFVVGLEEEFEISFEEMGHGDFSPETFGTVKQIADIISQQNKN